MNCPPDTEDAGMTTVAVLPAPKGAPPILAPASSPVMVKVTDPPVNAGFFTVTF
jgi:hypothetical protein